MIISLNGVPFNAAYDDLGSPSSLISSSAAACLTPEPRSSESRPSSSQSQLTDHIGVSVSDGLFYCALSLARVDTLPYDVILGCDWLALVHSAGRTFHSSHDTEATATSSEVPTLRHSDSRQPSLDTCESGCSCLDPTQTGDESHTPLDVLAWVLESVFRCLPASTRPLRAPLAHLLTSPFELLLCLQLAPALRQNFGSFFFTTPRICRPVFLGLSHILSASLTSRPLDLPRYDRCRRLRICDVAMAPQSGARKKKNKKERERKEKESQEAPQAPVSPSLPSPSLAPHDNADISTSGPPCRTASPQILPRLRPDREHGLRRLRAMFASPELRTTPTPTIAGTARSPFTVALGAVFSRPDDILNGISLATWGMPNDERREFLRYLPPDQLLIFATLTHMFVSEPDLAPFLLPPMADYVEDFVERCEEVLG
ncbi:hypothetical protein GGX14DRAFT_662820 [Mycena pura]|uniref:Uncharacterized protein n=1 Tax=Mycena pura TaxID=153505 RepID=A0AAD6YIC5_9AGAR|nr:hypothetical protein GGX14DRAFT_662820 [Mycena pura]